MQHKDNQDLLGCITEAEADLDKSDPAATRRVWRKLGAHLIAIHRQADETTVSILDMRGDLTEIKTSNETFQKEIRKTIYDPELGVIVKQNKQLDRINWSIRILSAIGAVLIFLLGFLTSAKALFGWPH